MKIKTVIIDDENLARLRVNNLLKEFTEISIIDECSTGKKAIESINNNNPDLVFLDIQLKDMDAFKVIESIDSNINPTIILITAYDQYAIKAFEVYIFDYLLKPFKDDRFITSTNKAITHIKRKRSEGIEQNIKNLIENSKKTSSQNQTFRKVIPVKVGNKVKFINPNDIKYIIASGYYSEIYTESKKHLLRISLSNLIIDLDSLNFLRIHRSYIINLGYIHELISSSYGEMDVKMKDNNQFRISKSYKKSFLIKMGLKE